MRCPGRYTLLDILILPLPSWPSGKASNSKGKNPSSGKKSPKRRMEPAMQHQGGQPAQHTTSQLLPRGGWNPRHCIKQDSQPNTLPVSYYPEEDGTQDATSSRAASPTLPTSYCPEEDGAKDAASSRTSESITLPMSYSSEEDGTGDPTSSRTASPTHYQQAIPQWRLEPATLHQAGQRAQHTTNELFRPRKETSLNETDKEARERQACGRFPLSPWIYFPLRVIRVA